MCSPAGDVVRRSGDEARPEDMAPHHLALLDREQPLGELGIGEHLEAALLIELRA